MAISILEGVERAESRHSRRWLGHVLAGLPFVRNVTWLLSGTGASMALVLASTPILSRIYSPEMFGVLAVFTSVLAIGSSFASLCYEMAIPLAENDETALNALALSMAILAGMSLLMAGAIMLSGQQFVIALDCQSLAPYLWLLPVGFLSGGAYQILSYWAFRKEAFREIAATRLSQGLGTVAIQVCSGLISRGAMGLLAGDIAGRLAGVGVLSRHAARSWAPGVITPDRLRFVAARYVKFPKFNVTANLLTAIATNIPVLMLSRYFGANVAGIYALTFRVLRAPIVLLGQAVGQAFFARAASMNRNRENLGVLTERTAVALFTVGLPVFTFLIVEGPGLFAVVFGERWRDGGAYARLLAPWFLLWLVANPLSGLFTVREWQGGTLLFSAAECTVQISALIAGVWLGSAEASMALLGGSAFCFSLIALARFFRAGHTSAWRIAKQAASPALAALVSSAGVTGLVRGSTFEFIVARFVLLMSIYFVVVWRFGWLRALSRQEAA